MTVLDGIARFFDLLRPGRRRSEAVRLEAPAVPPLSCPGCNTAPTIVPLAEDSITVMCLNRKCPKPAMLSEHFPTQGEAVDAWNEMVAPPDIKQREAIGASGSRSHFRKQ